MFSVFDEDFLSVICRSQLQPEQSLLQGFEDEVIVEKSKKARELALPDLLLSSSHAAGTASKSAPTPRIYFENKSKEKRRTLFLHFHLFDHLRHIFKCE